jgi:preprotein translocase subunit SecA
MFQDMMRGVREEIISMIFKVQIVNQPEEKPKPKVVSYGAPAKKAEQPGAAKKIKVGRNDPCPCGSGQKYKKCCLPKEG